MIPALFNPSRAALLLLTCMSALRGQAPERGDPLMAHRGDPQCWDSSSALLLEMRSPRIADTVPAFWELMGSLRDSEDGRHNTLFWDLARVFWEIYLDCVVSRSHGLGRRQVTSVRALIADKSVRLNGSGANSWLQLSVRLRRRGRVTTLKTPPESSKEQKSPRFI